MRMPDPLWLQLLRAECARTTVAATATRLRYSRTAISKTLHGSYVGSTERIATAVLAELAAWECLHTGDRISAADCKTIGTARAPTNNPMKLDHWQHCQRCPHCSRGEA